MLFTLEPLKAAEGDCLLLHWGTVDQPRIAVIDGGPGRIYEKSLRPRLDEIVANRELDRLQLDLVMISHVDNDHVVGIKKLLRRLQAEIESNAPQGDRTLSVRRLWHNTFNDVLGDSIDRYFQTLTASVQASVGGSPNPQVVDALAGAFRERQGEPEDDAAADAWDVAQVLAGHGEGRDVRLAHEFLFQRQQTAELNSPFRNAQGGPTLITAEMTPTPVKVSGLEFTVVGPLATEIEALQREFDDYIQDKGLTAEAVLAAYADKSVKNLSSIVCLAELGGRSILFTGDARGDKILAGLEKRKLLSPGGTLEVDVLKVPHHGSDRNVEPAFFSRVVADTYVFSGDGKHGNPERDTLEWLARARGKDAEYRMVLTYPVDEIDRTRKAEALKHGKEWDPEEHSLAAFFEGARDQGYAFTVDAGAPVKIDLGDEAVPW